MSSRGLGAMMAFYGGLSLVLPFFGLQFRMLSLFGGATKPIGIALLIVGILMMFIGGRE